MLLYSLRDGGHYNRFEFVTMKVMRSLRLFLLSAVAVVLFGCGSQSVNEAGQPRPKEIHTAVSLSPSTTEMFAAVGGYEYLKGRTSSCNYPDIVKSIPVVATVKPDYEALRQIKPELIAIDKSLYNEQDMAKIREVAGQVYVFDANTVDGFIDQVLQFGKTIQKEVDFSKYADRISQAVNSGRSIAPKPAVKVAVMLPGSTGSHLIAGSASFIADVIKQIGGVPVGPAGDAYTPYNAEFLISQNPDVIVTGGDPSAILTDPRLASLSAVKNKRLIVLIEDVLVRRGARVDKLIEGLSKSIAGLFAKSK